MKHFKWSFIILTVGLVASFLWGGVPALVLTVILTILEISLSFDNAIVNTTVLKTMSERWQKLFLTWGILIAVFGVRLVIPILIVALVASLNPLEVIILAIQDPVAYSKHLTNVHASISAFGGIFLILVFLSFFFDQKKDIHWLGGFEKKLTQIGKFGPINIVITLLILWAAINFTADAEKNQVMIAGIIGMILYIFLKTITNILNKKNKTPEHLIRHTGLTSFLYLEVLDASFSLDGVIGAFAITKDIVIVLLGLGIGAIFVRSLTIFFVHHGVLAQYRFLEHGAHYAIGALGFVMLSAIVIPIPEIITGLIGISFIGLALLSSIRHNRKIS